MVAPAQTLEGEREALLEFKMDELRTIANDIGADSARTKKQIVANILGRGRVLLVLCAPNQRAN